MKFSCDRCQTRYSIGDEKVRGKVLKIRCKTCGNIVVVREQQIAEAAAQPVAASATGPMPSQPVRASAPPPSRAAPKIEIEWYVAIKGKQHGPCGKDDVVRLFREGKITPRTYVWNEGMAAWTRLAQVPQFAALAAEAPVAPKRPSPPPPPSEDAHDSRGAEIIPFDEAKRARDGMNAGVTPHNNDPFSAVSQGMSGGDQAPRDSTRVFIMQAGLQGRDKKHRMYGVAATGVLVALAAVCTLDYENVVEIPGLHSVVAAVTQKPAEVAPAATGAAWDDAEEDPKLKCKLLPNPEECVKQTLASNEAKRKHRASHPQVAIGGTGAAGVNLDGAFNTAGGTGDGAIGHAGLDTVGGGLGAAGLSDADKAALATLHGDQKKAAIVKLKNPNDVAQPGIEGAELDPKNVAAVVKDNHPAIQDCIEKAAKSGSLPRGRQVLVVTVEPNGRVSAAKFKDASTQASDAGECITRAAKKWKFAPFPGPPTDAELPLILSAN